jgi:glycosyltransferase involved in cell wall biosynthesis
VKIIIATTQTPFIAGGAEIQVTSLKQALEKENHTVEVVALPFKGTPDDILCSVPYTRLLDLSQIHGHKVDRLIGLKFPAYLIPHPSKVIWLIHQQRDAYDLWESGHSALLDHPAGKGLREAIRNIDDLCFRETQSIFAESMTVAKRLKKFNQFEAQPLYHPPKNEELFYRSTPEPYLFFPSRLTPLKRQELVLKALSRTKNPVQLVLAGISDIPSYEGVIVDLIRELKVGDRVKMLGKISEQEKLDLYAKCLAVVYPPYDEDYGYVTLEAMLSSKPVVTCHDSGGTLEFVQAGKTGWTVSPDPYNLADCFDEIWENRTTAEHYGSAARDRYRQLGISWKKVVASLCE